MAEVIRPGQPRPTMARLRQDIDNIGAAVADLMRTVQANAEQSELRYEKLKAEVRSVRRHLAELESK